MPELDEPALLSQEATRSRRLRIAAITLVLLPLLLPFPFAFIALKWILPVIVKEWSQCPTYCPPSTYGERLEWLLILGPSMLVAAAAILLGIIGLVRMRYDPAISLKTVNWLYASVTFGVIWMIILGGLYWVIFEVVGLVP